MSRRIHGCPNGHDVGAYAPASALMGAGGLAGSETVSMDILVDDSYPFKALDTWMDGTAGVPLAVKDSWDFKPADDRLPCCLKCNLVFVRLGP